MEWIGVIGIVVGLVFFVVAAMRGWNVLITSIVTAIVIALTNGMDIMSSMVGTETSYVTGLAGFLRGNLIIFMGGAIMGIVGSIIAIAVSCLIIKFSLKRAQARGEHFVATEDDIEVEEDKNIPNLFLALLPLFLLIATIIGLSATGMKNVVYIGMLVGIIASIACFFKFVPSVKDSLGAGAVAGVGPAVFTSAAVGVGTVAAASVGFSVIYGAIFNMPGGTYVSAATMAAALGGIMGSGSGAVGIIAQNFLQPYLATGVDPAALAKIIATSATIGGALPNSGAMFGMLSAMKLTHKNSYKYIAAISIGAGLCALIVMIIMANLGIV